MQLADERDVCRGDVIALAQDLPTVTNEFSAMVCAMVDEPLRAGSRILVKHGTRTTQAVVRAIESRLDITTGDEDAEADSLTLNEIGRVRFATAQPLAIDDYRDNKATGSFIGIHPNINTTLLAGMIRLD